MKNKNYIIQLALLATVNAGCNSANTQTSAENAKPHLSTNLQSTIPYQGDINIWPTLKSEVNKQPEIEARIKKIMAGMTLEQKVAQMIQPEIRDISVEDMRKYGFGSYLNGGGSFPNGNKHSSTQDWIDLAEKMYQASIDDSLDGTTIPTMWGTDAVHGHNNVIGATLFPHNIGLGAMNNPKLIEKIAEVTAKEVMVTGIDWVFAPTVAVVQDDRWGRSYEGYSEHPEIVKSYSAAIVKGLQGAANEDFLSEKRVISTVKHFLGDGGTVGGDDQGNNIADEQTLFDVHAQGYVGGLTAGAQSVMASFNSWQGKKIHGSQYLLTQVLKDKMGFDGFVVGDWNGHGQIAGCTNGNCAQAVNAGLDIFMVPTDAWKPLFENTIAQVKAGEIAMSRIDDAVSRILRVKLRAGLFEKKSPANRLYSGKTELIGHKTHRAVAQQAVRESLVLLKNQNNLLPLSPKLNVLVAGDGADNIGKQSGGWTITWQGTGNTNQEFPGATSIYQGIKNQVEGAGGSAVLSVNGNYESKPDVAIIVFGEDPYAEGHGDRENLDYQRGNKTDLALLNKLKSQGIPVVSLFISGRPMWVNAELNASDAFVAVWLPGSEGQGVADVIFKDKNNNIKHDFKGKLSFSWPNDPMQVTVNYQEGIQSDNSYQPLLPYGYGLSYLNNKDTDLAIANHLNTNELNETFTIDKSLVTTRQIFNGTMQKPWLMWLVSGNEKLAVNANTHKFTGLAFRTIDKSVQEDSVQITLDGSINAGISILSKSNFREDLRSDIENKGALTFFVKLTDKLSPTAKVKVNMACDSGEGSGSACGASLDISDKLAKLPKNKWYKFAIDLQCFAEKGMKFSDTVSPFSLTSANPLEIGLADISIEPYSQEKSVINCQ